MDNQNKKYRDALPKNISRRSFMLRASVLATSTALLTLSPAGRALAGWAAGPGEQPEAVGRLLLQENSLAFNGERRDPVTGLYHLGQGYRAYNPRMMRFHAADSLSPFGGAGINPYAYCLGDPINAVDPTGHISWQAGLSIGLGILAVLIGIATLGVGIGASIGLAGSSAAISTAVAMKTALALTSSVSGGAAGILSIASGAVEDSNPTASANLGWASLAFGLASAITGIGSVAAGRAAVSAATQYSAIGAPTSASAVSSRTTLGAVEIIRGATSTNVATHGMPFAIQLNAAGQGVVNGKTFGGAILPFLVGGKTRIDLVTCFAGFGGKVSAAQLVANQTGRTVMATSTFATQMSHSALSFHPLTGVSKVASNLVGRALSNVVINRQSYLIAQSVVGMTQLIPTVL